jgi:Trp operon repressor
LVILGDESPTWRPTGFRSDLWRCSIDFAFPIVKLLDYQARWEELAASPNPFAIVVMAHLKAKETIHQPAARKDWKYHLTTLLYDKGYAEQDILNLFHFLDWLMNLPEDLEQQFQIELDQFEERRSMKYVTSIERMAIVRGRKEERRDIVLSLLNKKMSVAQIADTLDWSIAEVKRLAAESDQNPD